MLSPSDFNNAVPQFTNGDYASNPINPQYISEPSAVDYNKGAEPLQTLPAQWWNWFLNKFTARFNKVNIYVKNIFNELTQLLSLVSETPSGTEATPTIGQLKDMFENKYPSYLALLMYPVGSIYWTGKAPNDGGDPNELFGGTWVQIKNCFIWAKGDNDTVNATGGSKTVTLTEQQIPSHTHKVTASGTIGNTTASGTISGGSYTFSGTQVTTGNESAHEKFSGSASHSHNTIRLSNDSPTKEIAYATGNTYSESKFATSRTSNQLAGIWGKTDTQTVSISGTCTGDHTHKVTASGTISVTTNPTFTGTEHNHTFTGTEVTSVATGGGEAHDNMPPYIVKYCWERTA